jgi:nucleoside-diphosphate-sugar epimerase
MGQHVVITGAAGNVGRTVADGLEAKHTLTLLDQRERKDRETVRVHLGDFAAVLDRMPEADTVIHLGANPNEAEWQDILTNNIIATYNVFEVARRKGVRRIVFATTVMNYDGFVGRAEGEILTPEHHTWPLTYYAISKHMGEDLGKMYARKHGLSIVCIRLGWFPHLPIDPDAVRSQRLIVLGVGDCQRLFACAVEAPDVEFVVVNGFSREGAARYDLEPGRRVLAYEPQDDFEAVLAGHLARERQWAAQQ